MESREKAFIDMVSALQMGYVAGRLTKRNERLAFVVVLVAVTKQSIPQVLKIQNSHFIRNDNQCCLKITTSRAGNIQKFIFPEFVGKYVDEYCKKYHIGKDDLLFTFNSEYIGNRIRELAKVKQYDISISDIKKLIPYDIKSVQYEKKVEQYMKLLCPILEKEDYICNTGIELGIQIARFIEINFS